MAPSHALATRLLLASAPTGVAAAEVPGLAARLPTLRWHVALWVALTLVSVPSFLVPGMPVAAHNPPLAIVAATVTGVIGLALLELGLARFAALGSPLDLLVGLAFGTLSVADLASGLFGSVAGSLTSHPDAVAYLLLAVRVVASSLFLLGVASARWTVEPRLRRQHALLATTGVLLVLLLACLAIAAFGTALPPAVPPALRASVDQGVPVVDRLESRSLVFLVGEALDAVLLLAAALSFVRLVQRLADSHVAALARATILLFFAELHGLLFPPVAVEYVSTADLFRLTAYLMLLSSLVTTLVNDVVDRAAREERLRLSRDLHDGLTQQLSLLKLRLHQAASAARRPDQRQRDLDAALRQTESALLEARQAITTLRVAAVTWEEHRRALATFADEFSANHDVLVRLEAPEMGPTIRAEVHVTVLRVLHEALSNAIRHGAATCIEVRLAARDGWLELDVRDNGSGFDLDRAFAGTGVGINSMMERLQRLHGTVAFRSSPGQGATVSARLPVPA